MAKLKFTNLNAGAWAVIPVEVCILTGGLSSRMGRDKSRLRLGRKTLLGHVRAVAKETGWPVRMIRRDLVARCGPLGGILTALRTSRARHVIFLACDMPFVSPKLLLRLGRIGDEARQGTFVEIDGLVGFPFVLPISAGTTVKSLVASKQFSLQALAATLRSRRHAVRESDASTLFNVNTPGDRVKARQLMAERSVDLRTGTLSTGGMKAKVRPC